MEYILVSESVINAFVTTIQKVCGISSPIKVSHIPKLLYDFKMNNLDLMDAYLNNLPFNGKTMATVKYIRPYAFYNFGESINTEFTAVERIGSYAFYGCEKPMTVGFPNLLSVDAYAFAGCASLPTITLSTIRYIGSNAFNGCASLSSLYILTDTVPTLANSNVFLSTPIATTGSIFVKASMAEAFKRAASWSYYSNRVVKV